jgi:hypothetical protein
MRISGAVAQADVHLLRSTLHFDPIDTFKDRFAFSELRLKLLASAERHLVVDGQPCEAGSSGPHVSAKSKGRWNFILGRAHGVMSVYSDGRIRTVPPTNAGFRYVPTPSPACSNEDLYSGCIRGSAR